MIMQRKMILFDFVGFIFLPYLVVLKVYSILRDHSWRACETQISYIQDKWLNHCTISPILENPPYNLSFLAGKR